MKRDLECTASVDGSATEWAQARHLTSENSLKWKGAVETCKKLIREGKLEQLGALIKGLNVSGGGPPNELLLMPLFMMEVRETLRLVQLPKCSSLLKIASAISLSPKTLLEGGGNVSIEWACNEAIKHNKQAECVSFLQTLKGGLDFDLFPDSSLLEYFFFKICFSFRVWS